MSAPTIFRVVALIGTASPSPTPATAVLIPTTCPRPSTRAPPELPGFRAASVWITFSTTRVAPRGPTGSERPSAETTPAGAEAADPRRVPPAATAARDAQVPDRRGDPFGHGRHDARVRVERLVLAREDRVDEGQLSHARSS